MEVIIGSILVYIVFALVFNMCFYSLIVRKKWRWVIHLPKSKKYKDKIEPIYELSKPDSYYIRKYIFSYDDSWGTFITNSLLLSFTEFKSYQYFHDSSIFLAKNDVELQKFFLKNRTLKEEFERVKGEKDAFELIERNKEDEIKNKISVLNQEFKDNYVE